jgi:hypothetical protein
MPLDPLSDLNDVLNSAFSALGARTSGGQAAPPVGPSVAQQMQTAPERAGNMLLGALGPLGDAGRQVGEMMRTRSVDPRDLPLLAGNVLMGTMAPGGAEGGAAAHGTQSLEDIVAALARGVGRGEAHGTVANADVPQPSSLGYYGKSMWNPTVEMHYKNAGGTYVGKPQPGLSDEELNAQLAKNPGASIFDIAGTKAPAGPATYKGYALHESGEPGDYFVHDSDGNEVGQITKNGKWYSIDMNDGSKSAAQSPLEALQKAQLLHQNVAAAPAKPEMDLSEHLGPLNWESMTHNYAPASFEDIQARERARQLGFNIDNPLFKGGALKDYPENLYIPNKSYERGLFFSDNPTVANSYARYGASPLEYVARAERPMTVDWPSATGQSDYQESHMHALIEAARAKGADLLHIGNISDVGGKQDQYVVLDPSIVRAPSAAFDPARLKEAAPLAGLAGLSAGGLFFDENGNMKVAQ